MPAPRSGSGVRWHLYRTYISYNGLGMNYLATATAASKTRDRAHQCFAICNSEYHSESVKHRHGITVVRGVAQVLVASTVILHLIYSYNGYNGSSASFIDLHLVLVCTLHSSHLLFDEDELPVLKF